MYRINRVNSKKSQVQDLDLNSNEISMYSSMAKGTPAAPKNARSNTARSRKVNRNWLEFHLKLLNFSAKSGRGATINHENKIVIPKSVN